MENNLVVIPEYDSASIYPHTKTLSSSQILLYEKNPQEFFIRYVLGADDEESKSVAMKVGRIFSALHADRSFDYRSALKQIKAVGRLADLFERVIKFFPVVPAEVALVAPIGKWKVRATLDGWVDEHLVIIENKTGQTVWDQERVNFDDQITLQNWVVWKLKGVLASKTYLNWVCTSANPTQELVSFRTTRSVKAVKMMEARILAVIAGIEAENWTTPIYTEYRGG